MRSCLSQDDALAQALQRSLQYERRLTNIGDRRKSRRRRQGAAGKCESTLYTIPCFMSINHFSFSCRHLQPEVIAGAGHRGDAGGGRRRHFQEAATRARTAAAQQLARRHQQRHALTVVRQQRTLRRQLRAHDVIGHATASRAAAGGRKCERESLSERNVRWSEDLQVGDDVSLERAWRTGDSRPALAADEDAGDAHERSGEWDAGELRRRAAPRARQDHDVSESGFIILYYEIPLCGRLDFYSQVMAIKAL